MRSIPLVLVLAASSTQPAFTTEEMTPRDRLIYLFVNVRCSAEYLLLSDEENKKMLQATLDGYVRSGFMSWKQIEYFTKDSGFLFQQVDKRLSVLGGCKNILPTVKILVDKWKKYRGDRIPDKPQSRYTL